MQEWSGQLLPEITVRSSAKNFSTEPIEYEKIIALKEAVRLSPSSSNSQPWRVIFVSDTNVLPQVKSCLSDGNQVWNANVPLLVVFTANPEDDATKNGQPLYLFDCGLAARGLMVQAANMGLFVHPMGGWGETALQKALHLPEGVRVVCVIAVGYPQNFNKVGADADLVELPPRKRKASTNVTFDQYFGNN